MKIPYSGGCACGSIRYTGAREPVAMINCHCSDCQLSSGAPFASGIVVMTADLEISGTPKSYAVRGSSGGLATRSFCADCGTPLFTQGEANPQFTSIRFPSLDDSWISSRCWTFIPPVRSSGFASIRQSHTFLSRLRQAKSRRPRPDNCPATGLRNHITESPPR